MTQNDLWNKFEQSGKLTDYINYKSKIDNDRNHNDYKLKTSQVSKIDKNSSVKRRVSFE